MKKHLFRVVIAVMVCQPLIGAATVLYVHPDSALNSIQVALDSCDANDTVLVAPGIYYENIVWPYVQGINLLSEFGPDTTIIDASGEGSVIYMSLMPEDSATLISGFTIRNGKAWLGGGIHSLGGRPVITGNVITGNEAQWPPEYSIPLSDREYPVRHVVRENALSRAGPPPQGGGIYTEWSSAVIVNNVISSNYALQNGGGIACFCDAANISPLVEDNTITNNTAHTGGGVYIDCPFTMTVVKENIISDNTASRGGGIACYYVILPLLRITRNFVTENIADSAGGGIWCYVASQPIIDSCTISGNIGDGIYSDYYSSPLIFHNNITDNAGFGLHNSDPTELVIAEYNWWGHATGPYHPTTNPGGMGDMVSDYVDYDPWLTSPGVGAHVPQVAPVFALHVFPNPFSETVYIRYSIPEIDSGPKTAVSMKIYDAAGRLVKSFDPVSSIKNQESAVIWNGTDGSGRKLSSGVYFVELEVGDYTEAVKIILLR